MACRVSDDSRGARQEATGKLHSQESSISTADPRTAGIISAELMRCGLTLEAAYPLGPQREGKADLGWVGVL